MLYIYKNPGRYRVEVRETQANMAFREGHRCWGEDLFDEAK